MDAAPATTPGTPGTVAVPRRGVLFALLVLAGVLFVYAQTLRFDFTNWDDDRYVTDNTRLRPLSGAEILSQLSRFELGHYHPLTMLAFAADLRVAGKDPAWFHGMATVLHLLDTALVFLFVRMLTGDRLLGGLTAAIFAVHPTHVESVAWISARKDLLFTAFGLGALCAYCHWVRTARIGAFAAAFSLFVLSCLSKSMAVSIVPTLVLVDWQLGRDLGRRAVWLEKLPFAVVALAVGAIAVRAQQAAGALHGYAHVGVGTAFVLAGANVTVYALQQVVPVGLRPFYPYPEPNPLPASYVGLCLALVPLVALVAAGRCPPLVRFGVLFLVVNLAPALQLLPYAMAIRADRYTYFAGVGSALALAAGLVALGRRRPRWLVPAALAWGGVLALLAHRQCGIWRNSLTLWDEVIRTTPAAALAWGNRGAERYRRREYDLAEQDLRRAVELDAGNANHYTTLAAVAAKRGDWGTALAHLDRALALRPADSVILSNRAWVLSHAGDHAGAVRQADLAIASDPANAFAYANRGQARFESRDPAGAAADFDRAIDLRPDVADAYYRRAFLRLAAGDVARACADLEAGQGLTLLDEELAPQAAAARETACPPR
jgi:tetratricopeptide (TPR) repeat protein